MKTLCVSRMLFLTTMLLMAARSAHSQDDFKNLGFEDALIVPLNDPTKVATSNALPSWTAAFNGNLCSWVYFNTLSSEGAAIHIHNTNDYWRQMTGNYYVGLQSSGVDVPSIAQSAKIPQVARSLLLTVGSGSTIRASFSGEEIALYNTGHPNFPTYTLQGDISKYSGQTGELKFWGHSLIDDIRLSTEPLPRPPAPILPQMLPNGAFQFLLQGQSGKSCTIQLSSNLVNWLTLTNVPGTSNVFTIADPSAATNGQTRFYRTVSQ